MIAHTAATVQKDMQQAKRKISKRPLTPPRANSELQQITKAAEHNGKHRCPNHHVLDAKSQRFPFGHLPAQPVAASRQTAVAAPS